MQKSKNMKQSLIEIGTPPWSHKEIRSHLNEFQKIYESRPIKDNSGGMKSAHMFAVWFIAKKLKPEFIVESGIFKGQSTWLLEVACPKARIVSIDLNLNARVYISNNVEYSSVDFSEHDWSNIPENSLVFFDDHQNALKRTQQCLWYGFQDIIFEDNYPAIHGDCYSLKKVWSGSGSVNASFTQPRKALLAKIACKLLKYAGYYSAPGMPEYQPKHIAPNDHDAKVLSKWLEIYYEFPPIFKIEKTRWGDTWNELDYPTPDAILQPTERHLFPTFYEEALFYTWICYVRLRRMC